MEENVQLMHKALLIFNEHTFCNILASTTRQQFKVKFFIIIDQFLVQSYINKFFFFGCSPMEWAHQIPPTSDAYLFAKVMFQYLVPICLSPQNK